MPTTDLLILHCEQRDAKGGKPYWTLKVRFPSDGPTPLKEFDAKIWSEAKKASKGDLAAGAYATVVYSEAEFKGSVYMNIERYTIRTDLDATRFRTAPAVPQEDTYRWLFDYPWQHPDLSQFMANLDEFLQTSGRKAKFIEIPAGAKNHHSVRAGLLYHIKEMIELAFALIEHGPKHLMAPVDKDMVRAGVLLHDMGKVEEYDAETLGYSSTRIGAMFGHTVIGFKLVENLWPNPTTVSGSNDYRNRLQHAILAHHGQLAFGAPVTPLTPEALILQSVDGLSAKLNVHLCQSQTLADGGTPDYSKTLNGVAITDTYPAKQHG